MPQRSIDNLAPPELSPRIRIGYKTVEDPSTGRRIRRYAFLRDDEVVRPLTNEEVTRFIHHPTTQEQRATQSERVADSEPQGPKRTRRLGRKLLAFAAIPLTAFAIDMGKYNGMYTMGTFFGGINGTVEALTADDATLSERLTMPFEGVAVFVNKAKQDREASFAPTDQPSPALVSPEPSPTS